MGISEKVVNDPNVRVLLERRAKLKDKINRMQAEYTAIRKSTNRKL